ncbi:hypothetical protein PGQ11_012165 [Apiospora arundinis]|uniref:PH domain-containing protein n=1 Tax=Apiospora arundinis TaxID=335852 RepID=A0ABR2I1K7_9PEZI
MPPHEGAATSEPANGVEQPKFSRYRSQRGRNVPNAPLPPNAQHLISDGGVASGGAADRTETQQNQSHVESSSGKSIARSMSRYRRRPSVSGNANDATPKITDKTLSTPPVPSIPTTLKSSRRRDQVRTEKEEDAPVDDFRAPLSSPPRHQSRQTPPVNQQDSEMTDFEYRYDVAVAGDRNPRMTKTDMDDRSQRMREQREDALRHARDMAHNDALTDRLIEEQKKKDLERLRIQLANSNEPARRSSKPRSPVLEKFVALTKGRKSKDTVSPSMSPASSSSGSMDNNYAFTELPKPPKGIAPGGKGIVPQMDAPMSAVNAGDRIVSVRYRQHTFPFSVTPESTPEDIIRLAMKAYDHGQIAEQMVVLESYGPLGLERKIRRFEHVRDIMNSWDRDNHNHLIVAESDSPNDTQDLELESVPDTVDPPQGDRFYMQHSNRPGKWNKRWITLLDNGQMMSHKKPETSGVDKDTVRLCNLSDYDIYKPTPVQARRQLKPPKKFCFAIKSQHKSSMFMSTDNYVQYFCTEDPELASRFARTVFGWRSWYLVDRRPAAKPITIPKIDEKPPQLPAAVPKPISKVAPPATSSSARPSEASDESQYRLGEFEPLIDMGRFDKRLSQFGKDLILPAPAPAPAPPTTPKQQPHRKNSKAQKSDGVLINDIAPASDAAFTGGGLLAGGYEERKAAAAADQAKEPMKDSAQGPFTEGPSLLNKRPETPESPLESPSWFPSAVEHTMKHREVPSAKPQPKIYAGVTRKGSVSQGRSPPKSRPAPPRFALHPSMKPSSQFPSNALAPQYNGNSAPIFPAPPQGKPRTRPNDAVPHPLVVPGTKSRRGSPESSPINQRQPLQKPLINLEPTFNEPPQWAKKGGRGVQAPEGLNHLVDLISVGNPKGGPNSHLEVPPRSLMRRGQDGMPPTHHVHPAAAMSHNRGGGLARTRSKAAAPSMRHGRGDMPPMPPVQGMPGTVAPLRVQRPSAGPRQASADGMRSSPPRNRPPPAQMKRREHQSRDQEGSDYNSGSGRTGTLRAV